MRSRRSTAPGFRGKFKANRNSRILHYRIDNNILFLKYKSPCKVSRDSFVQGFLTMHSEFANSQPRTGGSKRDQDSFARTNKDLGV